MKLERFAYHPEGTYGRFSLPNGMTLFTVERPWLDNKPNVSCIPVGEYDCIPRQYHRGGYPASQVLDVPGRSYILFHVGNYVHNSQGCILVNSELSYTKRGIVGVRSRLAFDHFMEAYGASSFKLEIVNYPGGTL